jgi:hypothetical protein
VNKKQHKRWPIIISSLTQTMKLNNEICLPRTNPPVRSRTSLVGEVIPEAIPEVIPEAMPPTTQLSASSENTPHSLPTLQNISVFCKCKVFLIYNIKGKDTGGVAPLLPNLITGCR